jgi:alanine-glyoxylate transaminase/serine-glyoxylate transaminase/serine-pyruvate transaminase
MSPIAVAGPARSRLVKCRSFYLDLALLEDYWMARKYHHTLSTSLIYALREALQMVEEEGLEARVARHERHHHALVAGIEAMGLSLLPPVGERLWTLNTVRVPSGVDELAVRRMLLNTFNLEVGAGLGPLAGKIWRVGLMGASSTPQTLLQFLGVLEAALSAHGYQARGGAGVAAAGEALRQPVTV